MIGPQLLVIRPEHEWHPASTDRLRRILRAPIPQPGAVAIVDHVPDERLPFSAMYCESAPGNDPLCSVGDTALHILWTSTAAAHTVRLGPDAAAPGELREFPVHPGDTIVAPPRTPFEIGEGCLAFVISNGSIATASPARATSHPDPLPATHGLSVFHRYNRRTICAARPGLLLERWKITEPLSLDLVPGRWRYLTNLVDPIGVSWAGGALTLGPTGSCLVPPEVKALTIIPDSLAYVLIVSQPDLDHDVRAPLRSAGYDEAAIAKITGSLPA